MKLLFGALACILSLWLAAPASAQEDVAAFYRGKQLRMIVGTGPGGGYDLFARLMARHLGRHIPGSPTIVVARVIQTEGIAFSA